MWKHNKYDTLRIPHGIFVIKVIRKNGREEVFTEENLIVSQGLQYIAANIHGSNPVNLRYIVVSDSTTTPNVNETTLPGNNKWFVEAMKTMDDPVTLVWIGNFPLGGVVGSIGRFGVCVYSDGSGLFATTAHIPPIPLTDEDKLVVTYRLRIIFAAL